jgi:hypothetical protein
MANVFTTPGALSAVIQAQLGVPFIIPSSGSMANNGAITLTTALPITYSNCYLYLPASAISAGSTAGWYFAQMSSTTVGTVFNNTYSSGKPTIPASPTAFVTTGPGAYTQVVTEQTAHSITIPGGSLGSQGRIKAYALMSCPNNANNKTLQIKYGGTSFVSQTITTNLSTRIEGIIINVTASSQIFPTNTSGIAIGTGQSGVAVTTGSVNSASDQTLTTTVQLAAATDFVVINSCSFETMYSA